LLFAEKMFTLGGHAAAILGVTRFRVFQPFRSHWPEPSLF